VGNKTCERISLQQCFVSGTVWGKQLQHCAQVPWPEVQNHCFKMRDTAVQHSTAAVPPEIMQQSGAQAQKKKNTL